jgi:hypothetical protein
MRSGPFEYVGKYRATFLLSLRPSQTFLIAILYRSFGWRTGKPEHWDETRQLPLEVILLDGGQSGNQLLLAGVAVEKLFRPKIAKTELR